MIFKVNKEFFNIKDTLECGQIFRFSPYEKGYFVYSQDKCAYVYEQDNDTVIECEEKDYGYFYRYFDLDRDYEKIYLKAQADKAEILKVSSSLGKGIRILNQDPKEMLFSFIVSQNNNIPRIKKIIESMCVSSGDKKTFMGKEYFSFPTPESLSKKDDEYFVGVGLGYRAPFIKNLAKDFVNGFKIEDFSSLDTLKLRERLIKIYGVGPKVADCVLLFGFHRTDSFPVDTWIEKVYKEDYSGTEKDIKKISKYFTDKYKDNSGYFQQYLFYYKRNKENK